MSIATQLNKYMNGLKDSYDALWYQYPTMPEHKNMANLSDTIQTIYGIPMDVDADGYWVKDMSITTYTVPEQVVEIGDRAYAVAFKDNTALTSLDFSNVEQIDNGGCRNMCTGCTSLVSVDVSSIKTVGDSGLYYAFAGCTSLVSISFDSLTTIDNAGLNCVLSMTGGSNPAALTSVDLGEVITVGSSGLNAAFSHCPNLSNIDLSKLETLGTNGLRLAFWECTSLTSISFPALDTLGANALYECFRGCTSLTSISFPALTASSFGSDTDQFTRMLFQCSDVTVHFPAAIQPTIGSWASVTGGFNGTNTTVLFDL